MGWAAGLLRGFEWETQPQGYQGLEGRLEGFWKNLSFVSGSEDWCLPVVWEARRWEVGWCLL